ncbi:hypothetical protein [Halomonas daqiaonensis]|uniref:YfhG lipoprotein n=1 Tax=Halomonas daqiaonensis TaxID=650850 RepID=A0A1H7ML44_9GAMM|nr:hypothetical protein [Halomonas daqiaonensis]SEL12020.1 hypothetical protein SAMN04488129_10710 [Halomonas daqiaonensis]
MTARPWLMCLATALLAGCQYLPEQLQLPSGPSSQQSPSNGSSLCQAELPDFDNESCLLHDWVAFGLASQRGDQAWREATLTRLEGESNERRLARAVLLAWGNRLQWNLASELYKADLHAAPADLQPLVRYWLNELEGRRRRAGQLAESRIEREAAVEENAALTEELEALAEKLEQLTAIEQSINLRQQNE